MEMEPGLDHGRLGGLGYFGESDSVKMFDMSTVGGFREGIDEVRSRRGVAFCVNQWLPSLSSVMPRIYCRLTMAKD